MVLQISCKTREFGHLQHPATTGNFAQLVYEMVYKRHAFGLLAGSEKWGCNLALRRLRDCR